METNPTTTTAPAVVQVNFQSRRRPTLQSLGKGVYAYHRPCPDCATMVHPRDRKCPACQATAPDVVYWERPFVQGRQTTRKLKSTSLRHAQLEVGKNRSDQALAKIGRAADPYARAAVASVAELADVYVAAGCPKRNEAPRTGKQLGEERRRVENLKRHLGKRIWTKIGLPDLRDYHQARLVEISKDQPGRVAGAGDRAVELEENCLSSILRWAQKHERQTGVNANPVARDRPRHRRSDQVKHCREHMPANAEELHALARDLFEFHNSEVLGWLLLFQAFIGQRVSELLRLRRDAKNEQDPGFVKGRHLWLYRSQTHKGTFPYAEIHPALRECLRVHAIWLEQRFPRSPWYFPSPVDGGAQPVESGSLTHALDRICPALELPHRTSHGLRSYFVNALRSQGKSDAEIALRIGHKSGGRLIVDVYGEVLPTKLEWLPVQEDPAWSVWIHDGRPEQMDLGI